MYTYRIFDDMLSLGNVVDSFVNDSIWKRQEYPFVEIFEKNDELVVKALVAGIKRDELNVYLVDNNLIVEGEKKSDRSKEVKYLKAERGFGKFKKSIRMPYRVDPNEIKADLKDGVLYIGLKKSEDAKPKKIVIN